jgi:hypothetical protein
MHVLAPEQVCFFTSRSPSVGDHPARTEGPRGPSQSEHRSDIRISGNMSSELGFASINTRVAGVCHAHAHVHAELCLQALCTVGQLHDRIKVLQVAFLPQQCIHCPFSAGNQAHTMFPGDLQTFKSSVMQSQKEV